MCPRHQCILHPVKIFFACKYNHFRHQVLVSLSKVLIGRVSEILLDFYTFAVRTQKPPKKGDNLRNIELHSSDLKKSSLQRSLNKIVEYFIRMFYLLTSQSEVWFSMKASCHLLNEEIVAVSNLKNGLEYQMPTSIKDKMNFDRYLTSQPR